MSSDLFTVPRMPGGKISLELREQILAAFLEGKKVSEIAKDFKVSTAGIRGIIKSDERVGAVKANKINYDGARRISLLNKAFFVVESMIERCSDEFRMKSLVDSLNVLVHTRRIEEGLSGAAVQTMKPFTMNVLIQDNVRELASKDDFPELAAGDNIVDANPVEHHDEALPVPQDDFT